MLPCTIPGLTGRSSLFRVPKERGKGGNREFDFGREKRRERKQCSLSRVHTRAPRLGSFEYCTCIAIKSRLPKSPPPLRRPPASVEHTQTQTDTDTLHSQARVQFSSSSSLSLCTYVTSLFFHEQNKTKRQRKREKTPPTEPLLLLPLCCLSASVFASSTVKTGNFLFILRKKKEFHKRLYCYE